MEQVRFVRRAFKIMGGLSGIGAGVTFAFRMLNAPEAITVLMPIIETLWPIFGGAIAIGSAVLLIEVGIEYDKRKAMSIVSELERFVEEGNKRYHPLLFSFNVTAKPEIILNAIAQKHYKWLGVKTQDGKFVMSMATVNKAIERIESLKLYGFVRTRWRIYSEGPHWWKIIAKSKQNP